MKKLVFFLLAALPVMAGCDPAALTRSAAPGTEIRFSANTSYDNMPGTKTIYSGQTYDVALSGTTAKYERIDWVGGDKIRICSPQASHRYESRGWADYDIVAGSIVANGRNSSARITNEPGANGLVWGDAASYTFYALYPSPRTAGVDAAKVSITDNVITATLPAVQTVSAPAGSRVYAPDMRYAYMWAATEAATGPVDLYFKPLVTAFEFTLDSRDDASMELSGFSLVAETGSPALAGDFTATVGAGLTECPVTAVANSAPAIDVNFGGNITVVQGQPVTFTVFALPHDLTGLSIRIHKADGTTQELALKQGGQYVRFPGGKKIRITNVAVPAGETWTYTIEVVDPVTGVAYNASHPLTDYGHLKTTTRADGLPFVVKSYKTSSVTGLATPVIWKMQFKSGSSWVDAVSNSDFAGKLAVSATTGNGGTAGESVRSDIARDHTASEYYHHGSIGEDAGTATLRARMPLPSAISDAGDGYFDLSKHPVYGTIDGAEQAMETANCYVITAPGKYKLPLVYGNAIRAGSTNAVSYRPTLAPGTNDNDHYMRQFLRHDDQPIAGPWITVDNGISVTDAVVVWQDGSTSADMQILFVSDISVSGNYIMFEIDKEHIRPGNIVLAARSAGTIVWSWHLWVTEKDLTPISVNDLNPVTHQMMKYNLGWTDAISAGGYKWEDWNMPVRFVQIESGTEVGASESFTIAQHGETGEVDPNVGSNTFYQWGRKDPFLPANYGNSNRPYYSPSGYQITEPGPEGERVVWRALPSSTAQVTVGHAIQHPNIQYAREISKSGVTRRIYVGGNNPIIGNLWDANMIPYTNTAVHPTNPYDNRLAVKTVYDPCPPGFVVPYGRVYSGLVGSYDGWVAQSALPVGVTKVGGQGFRFRNVAGIVSGEIFFPFTGARGGNGEYIYDVSTLGYYWTSQPDNYNDQYAVYAKFFYLPAEGILRARHDQDRAAAYAVRPVRQVAF